MFLAPAILNGVSWSQHLDPVFRENYESDSTIGWQFFSSSVGFFRSYPGRWANNLHLKWWPTIIKGIYIDHFAHKIGEPYLAQLILVYTRFQVGIILLYVQLCEYSYSWIFRNKNANMMSLTHRWWAMSLLCYLPARVGLHCTINKCSIVNLGNEFIGTLVDRKCTVACMS